MTQLSQLFVMNAPLPNNPLLFLILPDLCTAVRGRFCDGQLISGQAVTITEVGVNPSTGCLEITDCEPLGLVEGPERSKLLRADISTHSRLSKSPLTRDPFEGVASIYTKKHHDTFI